jgi:hypothetical protein
MAHTDKNGIEHISDVAAANSSSPSIHDDGLKDTIADDEIVQNLAHAGEEVGLTWRSILAAGVSLLCSRITKIYR